uniref:Uncharacterized protein n=1 Tax=Rhizophora mucronata TaxID=61149 RepID=A0A2P2QU30_RHIMU
MVLVWVFVCLVFGLVLQFW